MWIMPTTITVMLGSGAFFVAGHVAHGWELATFFSLVTSAFACSFLITVTDAGVIPLPTASRPDPYRREDTWVECRYCRLRRPPRASHCHTCGVCVLEHDHHCGVLGGCVGLRSLRYFTGYLVSVSSAAACALSWIVRSWARLPPEPPQRDLDNRQSSAMAVHLVVGIFTANVVLVVGGLAVYYVALVARDTTRREAQGKRVKPPPPPARSAPVAAVGSHAVEMTVEREPLVVSEAPAESLSVASVAAFVDAPSPYHETRKLGPWASLVVRRFGNIGRVMFPPPSLVLDEPTAAYFTTTTAHASMPI